LEERANERPLNERSFEKIVLAKEQPMNVPSLFYLMNGKRRTNERQKNGGNLPTQGRAVPTAEHCSSLSRQEVSCFGEAVNNDKDGVPPSRGLRQICDEIHGDWRPRPFRNWQRLNEACLALPCKGYFIALARNATVIVSLS
jgi:hypothetical protein